MAVFAFNRVGISETRNGRHPHSGLHLVGITDIPTCQYRNNGAKGTVPSDMQIQYVQNILSARLLF